MADADGLPPTGSGDGLSAGRPMATLRLFASARESAGTAVETIGGATVGAVLAEACARHGDRFAEVLAESRVWVNGEPASRDAPVSDADEVAVLPPISGGAA